MRCNYVLCRTVSSIPISEVRMVYSCNSLTEGTFLHMIKNPQHRIEGDLKVCGDAVLPHFWYGFAEIFILTCGISGFTRLRSLRFHERLGHGYR